MLHHLQKMMPTNPTDRWWAAMGWTLLVAVLLTVLLIYGIGGYGWALFLLLPFFMGVSATVLYGSDGRPVSTAHATWLSAATIMLYAFCLLLFSIEGVICILMAAPVGVLFAAIGGTIGRALLTKYLPKAAQVVLLLVVFVPSLAFMERDSIPVVEPVVTTIIIDADPATVWQQVIEFPQLEEPTEWLFRSGISYPINATLDGTGVGAVRYCNFNTGSFVEPITVWEENRLLAFDVQEQPVPLQELSIWDIDAPHLHDFFVSKRGQFKLTLLPDGRTQLEGTTWYAHNIKPDIYWRLWSDWIIHSIHDRVLEHIKLRAEKSTYNG